LSKTETDEEYYRRRLAEEMQLAEDAETDVARSAHRRLAGLYAARLTHGDRPSYRRGMPRDPTE